MTSHPRLTRKRPDPKHAHRGLHTDDEQNRREAKTAWPTQWNGHSGFAWASTPHCQNSILAINPAENPPRPRAELTSSARYRGVLDGEPQVAAKTSLGLLHDRHTPRDDNKSQPTDLALVEYLPSAQ